MSALSTASQPVSTTSSGAPDSLSSAPSSRSDTPSSSTCPLCGSPPAKDIKVAPYCCKGCALVHRLSGASANRTSPTTLKRPDARYKLWDQHFEGSTYPLRVRFYLEGVVCLSCFQGVELLGKELPELAGVRVLLNQSQAEFILKEPFPISRLAKMLEGFGLKPHLLVQDEEGQKWERAQFRDQLKRIGVAAFCSANVMLFGLARYTGAEGQMGRVFDILSGILFSPVVFYSAVPLYVSSWKQALARRFTVDAPILVAIGVGALLSYAHLIQGSEAVYFDSLSALVFLLLSSRLVLQRILRGALEQTKMMDFLLPKGWDRMNPGDEMSIAPGQLIPGDGTLLSDHAWLDDSLFSGESRAFQRTKSNILMAGWVNLGHEIRVRLVATGQSTRLGQLMESFVQRASAVEDSTQLSDFWSKILFTGSSLVALGSWAFAPSFSEGLERALSVFLITCPCALGVILPLVGAYSIRSLARKGLLLRRPEVLDRVFRIRQIILDKTGTLTRRPGDQGASLRWSWKTKNGLPPSPFSETEFLGLLARCEWTAEATHPWARWVSELPQPKTWPQDLRILSSKEVVGEGLLAETTWGTLKLGAVPCDESRESGQIAMAAWWNQEWVATLSLSQELVPGTKQLIEKWMSQGKEIFILTGDTKQSTDETLKELPLPSSSIRSHLSPADKRAFTAAKTDTLVVGDGANDCPAYDVASVAVAVRGALQSNINAADVICTAQAAPGITGLDALFLEASHYNRTNRVCLAFSFVYNVTGLLLAAQGKVTPLTAAIIMPASSLTLFLIVSWFEHRRSSQPQKFGGPA